MMTLAPRGYGGFPSYQFSPPTHYSNRYYNGGHSRRHVSFAPHYPTKPLYQPPFRSVDHAMVPTVNQFREPGFGTQVLTLYNELDAQYRYEQYQRQLKKLEKKYWNMQANNLPPTMYPLPPPPPPLQTTDYFPGAVFQYEKETKYVPFPVYMGTRTRFFGQGGGGLTTNFTLGLGGSGGMDLPPKIRVIFMPTGQSFSQQPCAGSLAMPPFLYNRISEPFCSFALPPPLPQIGSLPLTPAVQQMVVQRYSNPLAVLSFAPNWQMPQMMAPSYPSFAQQPQQYMAPISAMPALPPPPQAYIPPPPAPVLAPTLPSAPQAYIPPLPAPVLAPTLPPAPQAYIPPPPAPVLAPTLSSAPQAYIPPLPPVVSSFSAAPQVYIPPPPPAPTSLPPIPQTYYPPPPPPPLAGSMTDPPPFPAIPQGSPMILSPPTSQYPSSSADAASSSYNGYPSICRACPPAPPPLTINVTGHCWIQHCGACHHVPTSNSNPNIRPDGGRITPLLRYPAVPQYVPEQTGQRYNHSDAPVMMRPWLRKTPPLPPGAVVIYDEYVHKRDSQSRYGNSRRQNQQEARDYRDNQRSTTVSSRKTTGTANLGFTRNHRSMSPKKRSNNNSIQQQGVTKPKSSAPLSTSSSVSSGLSGEYEKITFLPPGKAQQNPIPEPLTREARNVNLQYKYQPEELPTVYLNNQYLKSSSEASTPKSNIETPLNHSPQLSKELCLSPTSSSSSRRSKSANTNSKHEKEKTRPPRSPSHSKKSKEKLVIIREFMTSSPSTISTISSNMSFNIIDKDDDNDTLSTTSTIKAEQSKGDDVPLRHVI